jgi:hypothetical protein
MAINVAKTDKDAIGEKNLSFKVINPVIWYRKVVQEQRQKIWVRDYNSQGKKKVAKSYQWEWRMRLVCPPKFICQISNLQYLRM